MWGEIEVRRGLKRQARRRTLIINQPMREALVSLLAASRCKFVFTALTDVRQPLSVETLGGQARDMKRNGQFHADAGLHTLRHTFLTQLGETVDVFTLKKIAGHSSIKTTEKYVHPQREQVRQAFVVNMGGVVSKSLQNPHSGSVGSLDVGVNRL
jgi:site-specific recombinase XerD